MMNWFANKSLSQAVGQLIFHYSFGLFLFLFIIEFVEPGFVTNFFNPIWVLIVAIISGTVTNYDRWRHYKKT